MGWKGGNDMRDLIYGIVKSDPLMIADYTIYEVENEERQYVVISKDLQSAKDAIFIHMGQKVFIQGEVVKQDGFNKIICTERSMIRNIDNVKKSSDKE